jgi:phage gpG-like protein
MFRFRMEIAGQVQMDRGIARFADGVADYRPIWSVIGDDFRAQIARQFASEGTEGGEHWKELSPEYAKWKEAHFQGKPILERTGDLLRSLTVEGDPNAVFIGERKTLAMGSRIPYAVYHQKGRKKMPARPEIQLTEAFKRTTMAHMHQYLVQIASASGFRAGRTPGTPYGSAAGSGSDWRRALAVGW